MTALEDTRVAAEASSLRLIAADGLGDIAATLRALPSRLTSDERVPTVDEVGCVYRQKPFLISRFSLAATAMELEASHGGTTRFNHT